MDRTFTLLPKRLGVFLRWMERIGGVRGRSLCRIGWLERSPCGHQVSERQKSQQDVCRSLHHNNGMCFCAMFTHNKLTSNCPARQCLFRPATRCGLERGQLCPPVLEFRAQGCPRSASALAHASPKMSIAVFRRRAQAARATAVSASSGRTGRQPPSLHAHYSPRGR